jgi:hypothetical protein
MLSENWQGGELPQDGQTVVFPQSFNDFGSTACITPSDCKRGATVAVKPAVGEEVAESRMKTLILPRGKIQFAGKTRFVFANKRPDSVVPEAAIWNDHGSHGHDYGCANNWLRTDNHKNPSFKVPCYKDAVAFPDVSAQVISSFCLALCVGFGDHVLSFLLQLITDPTTQLLPFPFLICLCIE